MQHQMHVMSPAHGHSTLTWDPVDELSTEQAREEFDSLISKEYVGFADGGKTLVSEFDPAIKDLTMSPLVTAG